MCTKTTGMVSSLVRVVGVGVMTECWHLSGPPKVEVLDGDFREHVTIAISSAKPVALAPSWSSGGQEKIESILQRHHNPIYDRQENRPSHRHSSHIALISNHLVQSPLFQSGLDLRP